MLRRDFSKGWFPNADAVNGPPNCLLRMDNLVLDEEGALALRRGGASLHTLGGAPTVHSLHTAYLSGTRYRMAGAGAEAYANGVSLGIGFGAPAADDIAFGSQLGMIFMARGATKKKYDGTTVRNWGIGMTGGAPTVSPVASARRWLASCNQGESGWPENNTREMEGDAGTFRPAAGRTGVEGRAIELLPELPKGLAIVTRTFANPSDYSILYEPPGYGPIQQMSPNDLVQFWLYLATPESIVRITIQIDIGDGKFEDYFFHTWRRGDAVKVLMDRDEVIESYSGEFYGTPQERDQLYEEISRAQPGPIEKWVQPAFEGSPGWQQFSVPRGKFMRQGRTQDRGWNTVKALRLIVEAEQGGEFAAVRFDDIGIIGGAQRPISGKYRYRYVLVREGAEYETFSAPSDASEEILCEANAVTITVPLDAARDDQINKVWVYRMGGYLSQFYRVATANVPGGDELGKPVVVQDRTSDIDALIERKVMVVDTGPPPDGVIGVSEPYFDRVFVLTSGGLVYPSHRLGPEGFAEGTAIRVGHGGETPYWIKKAFGGLYIGTSRDIYRLEGTGGELEYGLLDFLLRPLNVGNPPISRALAHEGDMMIYLANDGWRFFNGESSQSIMRDVDLLYRGQARHGVDAVNLRHAGARFRAAIADGMLTAITPEGASTGASARLHRKDLRRERWYRHEYPVNWTSIHREPDGTLVAGDTTGRIVQLDEGVNDWGTAIPVVLHSIEDHDDKPDTRKDHWNARLLIDTGNVNASTRFKFDNTLDAAFNIQHDGILQFYKSLDKTSYRTQLQITGSFPRFRLYNWEITYRPRPQTLIFAEPKPSELSGRRKRFGGFNVSIMTFNENATVTPILDGNAQAAITVKTKDVKNRQLLMPSVVGYNLWAKVSCATGFELYGIEPIILEVFPQQMEGRLPNLAMEDEGEILGLDLKVCTLGVEREFTPIIDNVAVAARKFKITSHADEPVKVTIRFDTPVDARSFALSVNGPVEVYDVL